METDNPEEGSSGLKREERLIHHYGIITGQNVGSTYLTRIELRVIHRPMTNWIHLGPEGPYSLIIQGERRFLDEGSMIVISTKETKQTMATEERKNSVIANLMKALKSRLPIRVVRVTKTEPDAVTVYRYDGLYNMRKKFIVRGRLRFLLRRIKNQPEIQFNLKQTSGPMRHMLAVKKKISRRKNRSACIKKEIGIKKEMVSTGDPEINCSGRAIGTFCWEQFKEEVTLAEVNEVTYMCDGNDFEVWQDDMVIKGDCYNNSNDEVDEPTFVNYHQSVEKTETYYHHGEETVDLEDEEVAEQFSNEDVDEQFSNEEVAEQFSNEEVAEQFSNEEVFFDIPPVKCESAGSCDNGRTILTIDPGSVTPEFVKETSSGEDVDPLNVSDHMYGDINESKNSCEEKKSADFYPSKCENKDCGKGFQLATYQISHADLITPVISHACMYNLTLAQFFNLVGGTSEPVCPCQLPQSKALKHFESVLKSVFQEREKDRLKCIESCGDDSVKRKSLEKIEETRFYPFNNLFEQLTTVLSGKKNELQAPIIVKRKRILKKEKKRTRKFELKQYLNVAESLVTKEGPPGTILPYETPSLLREDEINTSGQMPEELEQLGVNDMYQSEQPQKIRRKKSKGYETASLGPVILPNNDGSPRSKKGRKLTCNSSYLRRSGRFAAQWREWEGEDRFLGFQGPFKPHKRLKLIKTYLKKNYESETKK